MSLTKNFYVITLFTVVVRVFKIGKIPEHAGNRKKKRENTNTLIVYIQTI